MRFGHDFGWVYPTGGRRRTDRRSAPYNVPRDAYAAGDIGREGQGKTGRVHGPAPRWEDAGFEGKSGRCTRSPRASALKTLGIMHCIPVANNSRFENKKRAIRGFYKVIVKLAQSVDRYTLTGIIFKYVHLSYVSVNRNKANWHEQNLQLISAWTR